MTFITLNSCNQKGGREIFNVRRQNPLPCCSRNLGSSLLILKVCVFIFQVCRYQCLEALFKFCSVFQDFKVKSLKMILVCPRLQRKDLQDADEFVRLTLQLCFQSPANYNFTSLFSSQRYLGGKTINFLSLSEEKIHTRFTFTQLQAFFSGAIAFTHRSHRALLILLSPS